MTAAFGKEIKVGDVVIVPCFVAEIDATDLWNPIVLSSVGRAAERGDATRFRVHPSAVIRANPGDDLRFKILNDSRGAFEAVVDMSLADAMNYSALFPPDWGDTNKKGAA